MKRDGRSLLLCVALLLISGAIPGHAQQQPADERDVSLKKLVPNIVDDQKAIWSFPARRAGKDLWATAAFAVAGTALIVGADPLATR